MRTVKLYYTCLLLKLTGVLLLAACRDEPKLLEYSAVETGSAYSGVYILSEGLFNQNNSSLSWLDFESGKLDTWQDGQQISTDCFQKANGRRLGDTANDMLLYGSRLYVAVNVSSTVEIIDAANSMSLAQIKMGAGNHSCEPRCLAAYGGKVYVCCYDGSVARIDTMTMKVDATCRVGRNPDGICVAQGKLYVSNSGGLDYCSPDSTVSVIDIGSFTETARIAVGPNPGSIDTDGTSVYVISRGSFDYDGMRYDSRLVRIDAYFDKVIQTMSVNAVKLQVSDDRLWLFGGSDGCIQLMECTDLMPVKADFIADAVRPECVYGLAYDTSTGSLLVLDAMDYVTPGSLLCYDRNGLLRYRVNGVGINPNTLAFGRASISGGGSTVLSGYPDRVVEYRPAPGQFIGLLPEYDEGDTPDVMNAKCLAQLLGQGVVSLGGLGGRITVGFSSPITNVSGQCDFEIDGNAFPGSSEAGVVWVSADANRNGLADDEWFRIAGTADSLASIADITYLKPENPDGDVYWHTSDGLTGKFCHNLYHRQSYWPLWLGADSLCCTAFRLPGNMTQNQNGTWVMQQLGQGYADDSPAGTDGSKFDIDWALRSDGTPARLSEISFIRVTTGVLGWTAATGELSTEISRIFDLHTAE